MIVKDYLSGSRAPRYSLLLALPLLVLYEVSSYALAGSSVRGVRSGADVALKSLFVALGGRYGLTAFNVALFGLGAALVWRDRRAHRGKLEGRMFLLMLGESAVWASVFGLVVGWLTALVLPRGLMLGVAPAQLDTATQLVVSLGAGIYEELLFRVILTGGLVLLLRAVPGIGIVGGSIGAVLVSALIFSASHYVGALGDRFTVASFTYRAIAGVAFSVLYVTRGLGITAWTHALYDVGVTLLQ